MSGDICGLKTWKVDMGRLSLVMESDDFVSIG